MLEAIWIAAFGPLLGEMLTTDPTSLELALVGVVTLLGYEILARPGHAHRNDLSRGQRMAEPPATVERRRVA
jgi:hypothetical protein